MKLSRTTHNELTKLLAELTAKNGKKRTYDEVIMDLIKFYKAKKTRET
ncbi:MAG: hypothetical protein H3Z52_06160 [archaeon]|nr:hypothetical protein [archaeon]